MTVLENAFQWPAFVRTRIAPTPSGYLHLGNIYGFAVTCAIARQTNAKILLRIDDLDRDRVHDKYLQDIFDTLDFLELPTDEGPKDIADFKASYSQVHRLPLYEDALTRLRDSGNVFACGCSRAAILKAAPDGLYPGICLHAGKSLDDPNVAWRFRTDATEQLEIRTLAASEVSYLAETEAHFVVRRKDGSPSYQLGSVIDDIQFGVDLVIRGYDLWPSTLAQHQLAAALGLQSFRNIHFYHHPILTAASGRKLSKSAGATSIQFLRKSGQKPKDIYATLGKMTGKAEPATHWSDFLPDLR